MPDRVPPGAFVDAGNYEDVFHPERAPGSPIRAWKMRAKALVAMRDATNDHEVRLKALELIDQKLSQLLSRPW